MRQTDGWWRFIFRSASGCGVDLGMNTTVSPSSSLSLSALRCAVGGVVGVVDAESAWDQLVWMWRVFWALDGFIALLRSIVERIASGEIVLDGRPVEAVVARLGCAGSGWVRSVGVETTGRRRLPRGVPAAELCAAGTLAAAVAGVRVAVVGRVADGRSLVGLRSAGGVERRAGGGLLRSATVGLPTVIFSKRVLQRTQNCVLIVPVIQ